MAKRSKAKQKTEEEEEEEWDKAFREPSYPERLAKQTDAIEEAKEKTKEEVKEEKKEAKEEAKLEKEVEKRKEKERDLKLYLYVFGEEFKKILTIPKFEKPITFQIIQSIRGFRETIHEGRIEINSSNENVVQVDDEEFEKHMQKVIEDEKEYLQEVQDQAIIENEFEEAVAEEDEKGRQAARKRDEEEQKRLAEMKKQLEEERLRKRTTVSEKAKTK